MAVSVSVGIVVVSLLPITTVRYRRRVCQFVAHESDEIIVLTIFGGVPLVAGVAQRFPVSAAIGAFLVGIVPGNFRC